MNTKTWIAIGAVFIGSVILIICIASMANFGKSTKQAIEQQKKAY